jgi:hypothetical protein
MDAAVVVLLSLLTALLVWGAFLCLFRRDRRASVADRRAEVRIPVPGRRRGDLAMVASIEHPAPAVNEEALTARRRRLAA